MFEQDTAGVSTHPASQLYSSQDKTRPNMSMHVMLESTGICDPDGASIPTQTMLRSALCNVAHDTADLYIH
jgi:hypothetical protein